MGIVQKTSAAKCLGEVPSKVIPSIFMELLQRSCQGKSVGKDKENEEQRMAGEEEHGGQFEHQA